MAKRRGSTKTRHKKPYITVGICRFADGDDFKNYPFETDGTTVQDVLSKAGLTLATGENVVDYDTAEDIELSKKVKDGQKLLISGNHKSGN